LCDCLVALSPATADGVTLFAKNSDRPPDEPQALERHDPRRESTTACTYIAVDGAAGDTIGFVGSRPTWMWGVEHGVNDAGVAAGNETIYTTLDPRGHPPALLGMDLVRLVLERAPTAADGVEVLTGLLERYGQGGSGHRDAARPYWSSFLVADPGDAWVVETSGRTWAAERVERTRAISNRTTIPSFDAAHRHPRQPVERLVDPRLACTNAVLAAEPVSAATVAAALRSHDGAVEPGWTVCMHVDGVEATTAAVIASLPTDRPPVARFLLGSPCASVFVPVVVGPPLGDPPPWEAFAGVDPAAVADLEARLWVAVDPGDPGWNADAWRQVRAVLEA
jgi:secernin